jgi:hypothetical protein
MGKHVKLFNIQTLLILRITFRRHQCDMHWYNDFIDGNNNVTVHSHHESRRLPIVGEDGRSNQIKPL